MAGVLLGVAILVERTGGWVGSGIWMLRGSHAWIMLGGFMIQLALGVALWILPKSRRRPGPGRTVLLAAASVLNVGVMVVAVAPLIAGGVGAGFLVGMFRPLGMVLMTAGTGVLVSAVYPRIQSAEAIREGFSRRQE